MSMTSFADAALWAAELARPTGTALGLPGFAYVSSDFHERERAKLFAPRWLAAAVASELPAAGDVLVREVAGWKLLFVRDAQGEIRCFHNLCRHRGMAVVTESCSKLHSLRCPWHGWNYALDGRLRGTPEYGGPGTHQAADFDQSQYGLLAVRCERWFDLLFVNIDGEAPPLQTALAPLIRRFAAFDNFSAYRYAESWEHTYECNWKIAVEGAIEDYHLPNVHPQITPGRKRADRSSVEVGEDCYYLVASQSSRLTNGRTPDGVLPLPQVPGITGADATSTFFLNIFPTGILGISPDGLYAGIWLPEGHTRTRLSFHFYFVGEEAAWAPRYEESRRRWIDLIRGVFEQDTSVARSVQEHAVLRDQIGLRTRFSPFWEGAVHGFQRHVLRLVSNT